MGENVLNEKRFYTNDIDIQVTNIDFKLGINYKSPDKTEKLCEVMMTPEEAKILKIMLDKAVNQYENQFRVVNVIENITKTEGEMANGGKK